MKYPSVLLITVFLASCGGDSEPAADPSLDDAAAEYQEEVKTKVRASAVKALAREWDVDEDNVECVLEKVRISQIEQVEVDAEVQAAFKDCNVDPAVVR
ncbi:MAG TPA: hypothetical protein VMO47_10565 [Rhodothermales bacterium]|nr:hypothetical protein [Rhodothermales bacterium]